MPPKDRSLPRSVEVTAYNLRIAGWSERRVYENLRSSLETAPSYRDLRAVYRRENIYYRTDLTEARHHNEFLNLNAGDRERPMREGHYAERKAVALSVDRTSDAEESFDEKYALGIMRRAGIDPADLADENMSARLQSIYEGQGS